jgi:hypothetical protein
MSKKGGTSKEVVHSWKNGLMFGSNVDFCWQEAIKNSAQINNTFFIF